jgi:hypothetical protein
VWAEALLLTQADSHPAEVGRHSRVTRIGYRLNGDRDLVEVALGEEDVLLPVEVPLEKRTRVRDLELVILDFEPGSEFKGEAGFAEVGLLGR